MKADEHYQKGMQHFVLDDLDSAIVELTQAVEADPNHSEALQALAMSHFHQKNLDKAVEFGERLRETAPENAMTYTSLSMFYQAQGRIQDAEDMGALAAKYTRADSEFF